MTLFVVATPIGNIQDITMRAVEVLSSATLILAEDTRSIKKLFSLLSISYADKQFIASHAQSSPDAMQRAVDACEGHTNIVLVTDAGTPAISDPGSLFVDMFRAQYVESAVVPVPGPSAITAALSVCGFPGNHFEFIGFIPHKKGRQTLFSSFATTEHTMVMYESPHRIMKTLESFCEFISDRYIFIGREMTKVFEEYKVGTAQELFEYFSSHPDKVRGEFVVIVAPSFYKPIKS